VLLAAYIDAFERQDVDALVGLLRDDAIVEMPPFDLWLRGTEDIRQWLIAVNALADHLLTPVSANGSPAVAVYTPETPGGPPTAFAIHVLDVVDGRISAIRSFIDPALFELFGLPQHPDF
jgi:RNA polymerase sigma-70 factor (ECF subfamily)